VEREASFPHIAARESRSSSKYVSQVSFRSPLNELAVVCEQDLVSEGHNSHSWHTYVEAHHAVEDLRIVLQQYLSLAKASQSCVAGEG
jgi:DNA-binding transcriptional regulator YbjK